MKRLPSLTGENGVFSVFGKGQAKIYINNREMRDVSELDNLNSADILNVEIVNNPGAKYDASVKAVIRINTVRKVGDGFSFDVRSSYYQSQNVDLTEQLNMNYRHGGWDIFGTISYGQVNSIQNSKISQTTFVDTIWTQENITLAERLERTLSAIVGVNYEISPNHYAGVKYSTSSYPKNQSKSTLNSLVNADGAFYDKWNSTETNKTLTNPTQRVNAYYNGNINKLNLNFNFDYFGSKSTTYSTAFETSQEYDNRSVNSENNVRNQLIASKLVFSYPILGGNFATGIDYTNTHRHDQFINEENIVPSSKTTIHEQNKAVFAEYSRGVSIGQISAGLRYENVRTDYFDNGTKVDEQSRTFGQWFPNVSFATGLKNVQLQLSYTAKTKRPSYRQLSNNVFYGNRFLLQTGNPYLKPTVAHDVTLVGAWRFVQFMASYRNEKDAIINWTEQMPENPAISVLSYRNLNNLPSLSAFLTISPTWKFWTPQLSGGFIKQWLTITMNNTPIKLEQPMFIASFNNSFSLPKGFNLSLDASFQGKGDYQNVHLTENIFVLNAGLTKSFLNDKLRVELKGHDVLYGKKDGNMLYNHQMKLYQLNRYDSREVELTIRYRFNSAKSRYKGTSAGQDEINRL